MFKTWQSNHSPTPGWRFHLSLEHFMTSFYGLWQPRSQGLSSSRPWDVKRRDQVLECSLLDVLFSSFRSVRFLHVFGLSFASVGSFDHDIRVFRCIIFEPWVFRFRDLRASFSSIAYFSSLRRLLFSTRAPFFLHHVPCVFRWLRTATTCDCNI